MPVGSVGRHSSRRATWPTTSGLMPRTGVTCRKGFTKRGELTKPEQTHTGEEPYGCGQCSKHFAQCTQLLTHHCGHNSERPFPCPTCGKGFCQKIALVKHHRVHERGRDKGGGEDISANTNANTDTDANGNANADTNASVKTNIDANISVNANAKVAGKDGENLAVPCRQLPIAEWSFSCSECGKTFFAQKAQLAVHHCTHSGEHPFLCAACGQAFTQKVALTTQQRVHTWEHQPLPALVPPAPHGEEWPFTRTICGS
ncbi:PREDICTED: zinc finger protein 12-like [Tauraco erythrolophus]|uniref:zinc finger protein 12-like n=1 Tax=Tauraco erythrolophus TaxID=121530 RepID=UPI0005231E73|nr:PREDICTED: zinc finger protein 12-like [Tauraco erythrolophus]